MYLKDKIKRLEKQELVKDKSSESIIVFDSTEETADDVHERIKHLETEDTYFLLIPDNGRDDK